MEFLFHTIVSFEGVPVYYNVYRGSDHYFLEVLENPGKVEGAVDFELRVVDGEWKCSVEYVVKQIEPVVEEIRHQIRRC
jgi:hypothetical protein